MSEDVLADRLKAILVNENDYFDVDDFDALPAILNDVIAQTCNVCPGKFHKKWFLVGVDVVIHEIRR